MRDAAASVPMPRDIGQDAGEVEAKVKEVLTDEQQSKFKELIGKPFDTAQLIAGRGGPGGDERRLVALPLHDTVQNRTRHDEHALFVVPFCLTSAAQRSSWTRQA